MGEYIPQAGSGNKDLPGLGGIFNQVNFQVYHYGGNNPIKYVDPDGRELKITGTEEFMTEVEGALQEIYPSAIVDKETGIVSFSDTVKTEGYESGKELLDNLIGSDNVYKIEETQRGSSSSSYYKKGEGSGSTIKFNPKDSEVDLDGDGKNEIVPSFIVFAHELGHSEAYDNGTHNPDKGDQTPGSTPPSEINSMKRENEVRKEHGLEIRPSY